MLNGAVIIIIVLLTLILVGVIIYFVIKVFKKCPACDSCCPTPSGPSGCPPDFQNDPTNCGSLGNTCAIDAGFVCSSGECVCGGLDEQVCSGVCTSTGTDNNNCGSCGNICPAGMKCSNGGCVCAQTICSTTITCNMTSNSTIITSSGAFTTELVGSVIVSPNVPTGTTVLLFTNSSSMRMSTTSTATNTQSTQFNVCTDTLADSNNCNACGVVCSAGRQCCGGQCINVLTNNSACGSCNNTCSGSLPDCCGGECTYRNVRVIVG